MSAPALVKIISVQMPVDLAERLEQLADEHERSLSAEIRLALKQHVATQAEENVA